MKRFFAPVMLALALILASGCTQANSTNPAQSSNQVGRVEIRVTDAPRSDNITEIWVGVSSVEIHKASPDGEQDGDGEWISANISGDNPFNLLALTNGVQEILGDVLIATGNYTQIRLNVDNVTVVFDSGDNTTAEVPSGLIKFVHPFEVVSLDEGATALLFDFDAAKSVVFAGNSGKILFKPVIKLTSEKLARGKDTLRIVPGGLPDGTVGVPYSSTLQVKNGVEPYTWNSPIGLPIGLTFANGTLSGTPTAADNFTFTVQVTDSSTEPKTASRDYTVEIHPAN